MEVDRQVLLVKVQKEISEMIVGRSLGRKLSLQGGLQRAVPC